MTSFDVSYKSNFIFLAFFVKTLPDYYVVRYVYKIEKYLLICTNCIQIRNFLEFYKIWYGCKVCEIQFLVFEILCLHSKASLKVKPKILQVNHTYIVGRYNGTIFALVEPSHPGTHVPQTYLRIFHKGENLRQLIYG